jgi:hypothetical protein
LMQRSCNQCHLRSISCLETSNAIMLVESKFIKYNEHAQVGNANGPELSGLLDSPMLVRHFDQKLNKKKTPTKMNVSE